jgi:hypothetical protein
MSLYGVEDRSSLHEAYHTLLDDYVAIVFVSLDYTAGLHTPDSSFGSAQVRNATRTLLSPSVCTGLNGFGHDHLHGFGHEH